MEKPQHNPEKEVFKHYEYVESLEHFLESSGEDTVDVDGILHQLPSSARLAFENLKSKGSGRVLDIGSGNGEKAIYLAHKLQELGINIVVDSIEPKAEQRDSLARNYQNENQKFFGTVSEQTLGEIKLDRKYDLALVIHSLYEFPRDEEGKILSLDSLGNLVSDQGAGVIVIEHPEGDFQKMKHELYPAFGKKMPVSQNVVVESLEAAGVPYKVGDKIEFRFPLDTIINKQEFEIGKAMAFLFSESLENQSLTESNYQAIGQWVKKNVRRDDKSHSYLWTPDICIWTFRK